MKPRFVACPRRPAWPLWAVALVLLWTSLLGASVLLSVHRGVPLELCLLKRLTGVPCPTCGSTRGVLALLSGEPVTALLYNPLVFVVAAVAATALALRITFARRLELDLTPRQRRALLPAGVLVLLANWAYVIRFVG
jgi:hypothetical protein